MSRIASLVKSAEKQTKLLLAITTAAVVGGASGAVVMASIPDNSGVIHACYGTGLLNKGQVRIIDDSNTSCNSNEAAITWNQQGPQGIQGPTGPTGPQGPQGPAGTVVNYNRRLQLNWGDIPAGGTPQKLFTVDGFGDVDITKCDSAGNYDYSFTNTSGQTIYVNQFGNGEGSIAPGATVFSGDSNFPSYTFAIGSGANSLAVQIGVNPVISSANQTCTFYGVQL